MKLCFAFCNFLIRDAITSIPLNCINFSKVIFSLRNCEIVRRNSNDLQSLRSSRENFVGVNSTIIDNLLRPTTPSASTVLESMSFHLLSLHPVFNFLPNFRTWKKKDAWRVCHKKISVNVRKKN